MQFFLLPGEQLFQHRLLPERVGAIFTRLEIDPETHARVQYIRGRPRCGTELVWSLKRAIQCKRLRSVDPDATVWTGGGPLSQQGLRVLEIPIGSPEIVRSQLEQTSLKHKVLFNRLTHVEDLQSAWLLVLFCANTRATYSLRGLPPQETEHFATEHDANSRRCFSLLLGVSVTQHS